MIDDLDLTSSLDDMEREADQTAQEALIPDGLWESHRAKETANPADVLDLARQADIHQAIVAGRIRFIKNNNRLLARQVEHGEIGRHFKEYSK